MKTRNWKVIISTLLAGKDARAYFKGTGTRREVERFEGYIYAELENRARSLFYCPIRDSTSRVCANAEAQFDSFVVLNEEQSG